MRAGLSTIQQTLTNEAANVLNQSIADAARRNHGQTTPLHVAATLLASPTGYLRQACIRSHPNSSHPLQCRALELCFTVALERLPTTTAAAGEPPINNALMAALKRAQAHQRRGCPENQQQPLLAVKVELEQLIISILDDPSVSRVMREASFSSPAVKAAIEQSLAASPPPPAAAAATPAAAIVPGPIVGLRLRPSLSPAPPQVGRNLYLNPRLQSAGAASDRQSSAARRKEDVRKVMEVLLRSRKRNPVIVGDAEPEAVARELVQMIENKEIAEAPLRNLRVVSLEKEFGSDKAQIHGKMKALEGLIDARIGSGVILDLGDLKWLVEQPSSRFTGGPIQQPPQQHLVSGTGRAVVAEMAKLLAKYDGGDEAVAQRLWVMGTATCETYLRCQVYHPSMENDWDLQAVPIAARAPIAGVFSRIGGNTMLGSALAAGVAGAGAFRRLPENAEPKFCPSCTENYDKEMAKLGAKEEPEELSRSTLPQWMQMAKIGSEKSMASPEGKEPEQGVKKRVEELQKKWRDNCRLLHPSFHTSSVSGRVAAVNPIVGSGLFGKLPIGASPPPPPHSLINPKLHLAPRNHLLLQSNPPAPSPEQPSSPPTSPVRTDLVLGRPKTTPVSENTAHGERVKDLAGCISSDWRRLDDLGSVHQNLVKQAAAMDADSFKNLFKGLSERVAWQTDAASIVATTVIQSKSGNPKRRAGQAKGDTWMLFLGPDRVGKKRMASALSDLLCRPPPVTMRLGNRSLRRRRDGADDDLGESDFRGKTVVDRLAEAVRRNPLSIVVLEEIDQADMLVYAGLRRAMDRGRLVDSHGREVSLGSTIFILTSDWLPENAMKSFEPTSPRSAKIAAMAAGDSNWQLRLDTAAKTSKRRADWSSDEDDRSSRPRKESADRDGDGAGLSFDLNMAASSEVEEAVSGGELTSPPPPPRDLPEIVDETVIFRPVDFAPLRDKVAAAIAAKFSEAAGDGRRAAIEVDDDALDRIAGGVWFGRTGLEEWANRVLAPGFRRLRSGPVAGVEDDGSRIVRLVASERGPSWEGDGGDDWLPSRVSVDSV